MATIPELMAAAADHHRAGRLVQAEQSYRQILQIDPRQPGAWHLLGVLASQLGENERAVGYIQRAIQLRPGDGAFHRNLGVVYEQVPDLDKAVRCHRRALDMQPDSAEANYTLANALKAGGNLDDAVRYYRRAVGLNPGFAEAHNNLGSILKEQGKPDEAVASYEKALESKRDFAEAHHNLGAALLQLGKAAEAEACVKRALELKPDMAIAHNTLGTILGSQSKYDLAVSCFRRALEIDPQSADASSGLAGAFRNQGNLAQAAASYRRALELSPGSSETLNNLGITLQELGNIDEAVDCYHQALKLAPEFAEAYNNWGTALQHQYKPDEAVKRFREAVNLRSDLPEAYVNLGNALRDLGQLDESAASYESAIQIDPASIPALTQLVQQSKHLCRWDDLGRLTEKIISAVEGGISGVPPFNFINLPTSAKQQLRCARQHAERVSKCALHQCGGSDFRFVRKRRPRIKLGYVSVDFREHAITWLVAELIERHDRDRFEVIGYSYGPDDQSGSRRRVADAFDRFVDIRDVSPSAAAQRIYDDEVDIAVDLTGYLPRAREAILALRPAPVQVSFLGFTGTMGAPWMDYIIVDDFVVPPDQKGFFAEKAVRLPDCYLVNDSKREISASTPSRLDCGLPERGFVFCSFNQTHKITPEVFEVWMNLLKNDEESVLWLWESNRYAPPNLRREAAAQGVDPSRLIFAPSLPQAEHLARYRLADLVLDTFPYNGHTTTGDALWVGCPVLACAGETFVSRVAGSLLRAAGLPELATHSIEDYGRLAQEIAANPARLAGYRGHLTKNRDTVAVFDCGRFTRNIESAFDQMWELYQSGKPPQPIAVR